MKRCSLLPLCSLLLLLPVFALASAGQEKTLSPVPASQVAPPPVENLPVARVFGDTITEKDVLDAINRIASQQPVTREQLQQKNTTFFKEALETLVGLAALRNEAKEKNITTTSARVDEALQDLKKRFPNEEQFKVALIGQGVTEADVRKQVEDNLILQQAVDIALAQLPGPTAEDIEKFYDDNPQYFVSPEQVHAAHILIRVDPAATPEKKAEARKKLEDLRADIESKKTSFAEAAKVSEDKSNSDKGGDLGFFPRGRMVKPFEDAVFSAKPGSVTGIVETQFGYHLIHVIESRPAGKKTLEESKRDIAGFLERKGKQEAAQRHIEALKAKASVERMMTEEIWNKRHAGK